MHRHTISAMLPTCPSPYDTFLCRASPWPHWLAQAYATHKLYATLAASTTQPVLLQLAVWCVGEYGELLVSTPPPEGAGEQPAPTTVVELLANVLRSPIADMVTKEYTINALMKLTSRFAAGSLALALIHKQLAQYSTSMSLELQQRSVEYSSLLKLESSARRTRASAAQRCTPQAIAFALPHH